MAETEVESILREIRERVLSQQRADQDLAASAVARTTTGNAGNGASNSGFARAGDNETTTAEKLALISSCLTTTARAWDRLPPLVSNRSGLAARLELWLKRHVKRATRWYAWEQVNFNAAVHQALRDILVLLSAYEQELRKLRAQIKAEAETRQIETQQHQADLTAQLEAQRIQVDVLVRQLREGDERLQAQLRERGERLQEEQRICFKQLALETSEAAMLEDRARRKTEALLEDLKRRVEQLESDE